MRFFHPKKKFYAWIQRVMKKHPKAVLVDCGAGDGDLVAELLQLGLPCIGIDPQWGGLPRGKGMEGVELAQKMICQNAEESTFVTKMPAVLLCCRPCHSAFPARINRARHKDSVFYYIGFKKNLIWDLAGAPVKLLVSGVGKEGECVWAVGAADADRPCVSPEMQELLKLVGI